LRHADQSKKHVVLVQRQAALIRMNQTENSVGVDIFESRRIADTMQGIAATLPDGSTKSLLKSFEICSQCKKFIRIGEAHDGGYLMCSDQLGSQIQAAYSAGIEQHDKFSSDIYNLLHVPVHQFDCTVAATAQSCDGCHFHKVCFKGEDGRGAMSGKTSWTLNEVLSETGAANAPARSLVMKMDIEGAEWFVLNPRGVDSVDWGKFSQLVIEFHSIGNEKRHEEYLGGLTKLLDAGFKVAHIHGNNCCGMYTKGEYSLPDVLEVTLVMQEGGDHICSRDQKYEDSDSPNLVSGDLPELPFATLP
jgi:hypothetical protein